MRGVPAMRDTVRGRLLRGVVVPRAAEAIIKYDGKPRRLTTTEYNLESRRFEDVDAFEYDGPLQYVNPRRGPMRGREGWRAMKGGDPRRLAWAEAGRPVGVFAVLPGPILLKIWRRKR